MKLFDDIKRTNIKPAKNLHNPYEYYNQSARKEIASIRSLLNNWFDNYPESEKAELKSRFKNSFSSTFYELFLHEFFLKLGFKLKSHPKIKGTNKRPDFLVEGHGIGFYIEAKEAKDQTDKELKLKHKIDNLYDQIEKTDSPNFYLHIVNLNFLSNKQPKGKDIIQFLERELPKYNPDDKIEEMKESGLRNLNTLFYRDADVEIEFSLIPRPKDTRNKNRPTIGVFPIKSRAVKTEDSIKLAIKKKATRYGQLDKPYLICINLTSKWGVDEIAVLNSVLGDEQILIYQTQEGHNYELNRKMNGIFINKSGPQYTRVSGVLITDVNSVNLSIAKHWLIENPFCEKKLDLNKIGLSELKVSKNRIKKISGKSIIEILEISENWLKS